MNIQNLSVEALIPYEFNNKKHDSVQINRIANSIKEFGFTQPIVVDSDNIIIIGHGRFEAAKKLGLKEVPVVKADTLDAKQVKKLRILDNKLNESEWNVDNLRMELEEIGDLSFGDISLNMEEFGDELSDTVEGMGQELDGSTYTKKIDTPIYTPEGIDVTIADMVNLDKQQELESKIEKSKLPFEIKEFLKWASYRHIEFNYKNIAEFYAKADKETQELMEDSALVIIDYDKAIADGYTTLYNLLTDGAEKDED